MATDAGTATFRALADFSRVRREARKTKKELDQMTSVIGNAGTRMGRMLFRGFMIGTAGASVLLPLLGAIGAAGLSSVASLLTLAQSLLAVGGAAFLLPGIIGGFAVGIGVLFAVLKDGGKVLKDLGPKFTKLQKALSSSYWNQAAGPIRTLVNDLMPQLHKQLKPISRGLGQMTADLAKALGTSLKGRPLDEMMGNTSKSIQIARGAVAPLVRAFTTLGRVGSEYLPRLAKWFVNISEEFEQFIAQADKDGRLKQWIEDGIQGLKDIWSILKSTIGIFGALTKAANAAGSGTTLGKLADGLEKVAKIMNGKAFQKGLTEIFKGASKGTDGLLAAIGPVGKAFEKGAKSLGEFLRLGGEITGLVIGGIANALADETWGKGLISFMESLKAGVKLMLPILPTLFAALGNLLTVAGPLLMAFGPSLAGALKIIAEVLTGVIVALYPLLMVIASSPHLLAGFLIAFVAIKVAMLAFTTVQTVVGLARLMKAIMMTTVELAKNGTAWLLLKTRMLLAKAAAAGAWLGGLITSLGKGTVALVKNTAAWVLNIAQMALAKVAAAGSWLLGMIGMIGRMTAKLALNTAAWVLNIAQIALAKAAAAGSWLVGMIGTVGRLTAALALNTAAWMANKAQIVLAKAAAAGSWLLGVLTSLGRVTLALALNTAAWVANKVVLIAGKIATALATAAQWLLNAAMLANPIVLIIVAVLALVAALVWFFTQTKLGQQIWGGFVNFLKGILAGFIGWWNGTFMPGVMRVFAAIKAGLAAFGAAWSAMWSRIIAFLLSVGARIFGFVASIPGRVVGLLAGLARLAGLAIKWFMGLLKGATEAGARLFTFVASIPGKVLGFLGNLGSLLLGAGRSLIQGFIDGIVGMIGNVSSAVGSVMNTIAGFFPHSPAKKGAFSGRGWTPYSGRALMVGFATGIKRGGGAAVKATDTAMKAVSKALANGLVDGKKLVGKRVEELAKTLSFGMGKDATKAIVKQIKAREKAIVAAAKVSEKLQEKIAAAQEKRDEKLQEMREYGAEVKKGITDTGELGGLYGNIEGPKTVDNLIAGMRKAVSAAREYRADVERLNAMGLNESLLKGMVDAGVGSSAEVADMLARASKSQIATLNQQYGKLGQQGGLLGKSTSQDFFGTGVASAQGVVDGLWSQAKSIADAVTKIMRGAVKAAKVELKINSPSKVFEWIGKMMGQGGTRGIVRETGSVVGAVKDMASAATGAMQVGGTLDPTKVLGAKFRGVDGVMPDVASQPAPAMAPAAGVTRSLAVTVNNPLPEPPSKSIERTYSKIAYLGLDAEELASV